MKGAALTSLRVGIAVWGVVSAALITVVAYVAGLFATLSVCFDSDVDVPQTASDRFCNSAALTPYVWTELCLPGILVLGFTAVGVWRSRGGPVGWGILTAVVLCFLMTAPLFFYLGTR